jgi:hypothetical protein
VAFEISAADLPSDAISITLRCSAKQIRPILLFFERLIISDVQSGSPADASIVPRYQQSKQRYFFELQLCCWMHSPPRGNAIEAAIKMFLCSLWNAGHAIVPLTGV